MARDTQKSKVYAAERSHSLSKVGRRDPMTITECQAYVDKILDSAYIKRHYSVGPRKAVRRITVGYGRNGGMAYWDRITLGVWARQPMVILHEMAHVLAGPSHGHDWRFAEVFLDLIRHALGKEAEAEMRAAFKEYKVRYRRPIKRGPVTPERRAELIEQLAAARAARSTP